MLLITEASCYGVIKNKNVSNFSVTNLINTFYKHSFL
jgi:hypothetical protein